MEERREIHYAKLQTAWRKKTELIGAYAFALHPGVSLVDIPLGEHLVLITATADAVVSSFACPWTQQSHLWHKFPKGIGEQSSFPALIAVVMAGMELPSSSPTKALHVKRTKKYAPVLGAPAWCNASWKGQSSTALLTLSDILITLAPLHHSQLACILPNVLGKSLCNNITTYEY